jgi:hypothetical protein
MRDTGTSECPSNCEGPGVEVRRASHHTVRRRIWRDVGPLDSHETVKPSRNVPAWIRTHNVAWQEARQQAANGADAVVSGVVDLAVLSLFCTPRNCERPVSWLKQRQEALRRGSSLPPHSTEER